MNRLESADQERLRRWRLVLGGPADGEGSGRCELNGDDLAMDRALTALYDQTRAEAQRRGGLGSSAPAVSRWLGDIRKYFPSSVVKVMQQDALEKLDLRRMLLEPEMMEAVTPDVHLAATLISLADVMPAQVKETARVVVGKVLAELERRLAEPLRSAITGSLNRAVRNQRPRHSEIDWNRTIRANLKHYQPNYRTVVPERLIGYGRKRSSLRDVVLCIDQSGSMASSVVYASVFGAVLASLKSISTKLVLFDTAIVDLSDQLDDPVDVLFGVRLGGGTDINLALGYCQSLVRRPDDTVLILISDLYEGGNEREMLQRAAALVHSGVQVISLLALSDDGRPAYDHNMARQYANLGIPTFACTPDLFPDLMAAALQRQDLAQWAGEHEIALAARAG
ncbi:VWA domain-containing protein [Chitinimonas lacunae]|uniref:VWA domain-containing protein n=1 Tax=Chitinimonas lacunae TaxID=1963018 RepID=A0ABV8MT55_9NEIS